MQVIFKSDAFIDGTFYRKSPYPQFVPDGTKLPSSAKVTQDTKPVEPKKEEQTATLRDFDEVRAASDAEQKLKNKYSK